MTFKKTTFFNKKMFMNIIYRMGEKGIEQCKKKKGYFDKQVPGRFLLWFDYFHVIFFIKKKIMSIQRGKDVSH